eukprot:11720901-Prorocentrum_lima.AAC.1
MECVHPVTCDGKPAASPQPKKGLSGKAAFRQAITDHVARVQPPKRMQSARFQPVANSPQ